MPSLLSDVFAILISPEGIVAATLVSVVTIRFFLALKRGLLDFGNSTVRQVWLMWSVYFCLATASVFHLFDKRIGATSNTLSWIVAAVVASLGYILVAAICVEISPIRPRWNWPILAGALTISLILIATLWLPTYSTVFSGYGELIAHVCFALYLFFVIFRLVVPAFYWSYQHETQTPMRLRFALMIATHVAIAAWMVNSLIENTCLLLGWSYNQDPIYYVLLTVAAPSFVLSYLLPASYFVKFIVLMNYIIDLATLLMMRNLENKIAALTQVGSTPGSLWEWVWTPGSAIYRSAIAIFDSRKRLAQASSSDARSLAAEIEKIARPDLPYPFVIRRLRRIGLATTFQAARSVVSRSTIRA